MVEPGPGRALGPWAIVGLFAAFWFAIHPPRIVSGDLYKLGQGWKEAQDEALRGVQRSDADLILLGDSRLGAVFAATDLDRWARGCGFPGASAAGGFVPNLDFSELGPRRLRLERPKLVILQLELFLVVPFTPAGMATSARKSRSEAAFTIGREFVQSLHLQGGRAVAVELPLSEAERASFGPRYAGFLEDGVRRVEALGVPVWRAGPGWGADAFTDGIHLNAVAAARARAWLCGALADEEGDASAHQ